MLSRDDFRIIERAESYTLPPYYVVERRRLVILFGLILLTYWRVVERYYAGSDNWSEETFTSRYKALIYIEEQINHINSTRQFKPTSKIIK